MQTYATPVPKEIVLRPIAMWHMVSSASHEEKPLLPILASSLLGWHWVFPILSNGA
jgi:hypothetical protein